MTYPVRYTDEHKDYVRAAWNSGTSAAIIAQAMQTKFGMTVTRSAIIGLTKRLKCPLRESNGPWRVEGLARRDATLAATHGPKPKRPAQPAPVPSAEALAPIGPVGDFPAQGACRWPVQDLPDFQCCGHPVDENRPYCAHHAGRAYSPVKKPMTGQSASDRQFRG